jgi:hypothetical protein
MVHLKHTFRATYQLPSRHTRVSFASAQKKHADQHPALHYKVPLCKCVRRYEQITQNTHHPISAWHSISTPAVSPELGLSLAWTLWTPETCEGRVIILHYDLGSTSNGFERSTQRETLRERSRQDTHVVEREQGYLSETEKERDWENENTEQHLQNYMR